MSAPPSGRAAAMPYNVEPDGRPPRGERLRQRYGGGYVPFVQRRRGPAPMASVEDISVKSLEISPPEETMPTTASQQHQQAAELCRAAGQAWREEDGAHYQYSGYDTGIMEDNNRRSFRNYQSLLDRLEDNGAEREILQVRRDQSVTLNYREGYMDILRPTEGLERSAVGGGGGVCPNERVREVYVRRTSERSDGSGVGGFLVGGFSGGWGGYGPGYDVPPNATQVAPQYAAAYASSYIPAVVPQVVPASTTGPYAQRQFRMIDASNADLRDPIDRSRRYSNTSNQTGGDTGGMTAARGSRFGSFSSDSTIKSGGSPGTMAIETSFCGQKPIAQEPSFDMGPVAAEPARAGRSLPPNEVPVRMQVGSLGSSNSPSASDDGRNLVDEINRRSQLPLTKQDSYANAIYQSVSSSSSSRKHVRKQGSYEAAVESGLKAEEAIRRSKELQAKMRKQDSYIRAIGGSFEDGDRNGQQQQQQQPQRSPKVRKQESYLKAVGEMSPENEDGGGVGSASSYAPYTSSSSPSRQRIAKQDSYLRAVGKFSTEDELTPLPTRVNRPMRKQDSYQRAMQSGSLSFSDSFDRSCIKEQEEGNSPRANRRAPVRKQDSYTRAILSGAFATDESDSGGESSRVTAKEYSKPQTAEEAAAVAIQSVFKGYRTRKDIQEIKTFYQQVSETDPPLQAPANVRPAEPLSMKKRQDSYLQAVGSPDDLDDVDGPMTGGGQNVRSWKVRQDSYQMAMTSISPDNDQPNSYVEAINEKVTKAKRQDSYMQAMDKAEEFAPKAPPPPQERKKSWSARQDSYQRALESDHQAQEDEDDGEMVRHRTVTRVDTESSSDDGGGIGRSDSLKKYKVVVAFKKKEPKGPQADDEDDLPDLEDKDVAKAALKIQSVFRGFKVRKDPGFGSMVQTVQAAKKIQAAYRGFQGRKRFEQKKKEKDLGLPDLDSKDVKHAALKIQSVYRGFKVRKTAGPGAFETARAAMTIQRAFRRFKARKQRQQKVALEKQESLPDLEDKGVQAATVKIQSVFRGFQSRKKMKSTFEVVRAALIIQSAYRGFRARKQAESEKKSVVKIQSAFRGAQARREARKEKEAVVKIQSTFRGHKVRKEKETQEEKKPAQEEKKPAKKEAEEEEDLPDLESQKVKDAALSIQAAFRGFQVRRKKMETAGEVAGAAMKIQAAYRGFQTRKRMKDEPASRAAKTTGKAIPEKGHNEKLGAAAAVKDKGKAPKEVGTKGKKSDSSATSNRADGDAKQLERGQKKVSQTVTATNDVAPKESPSKAQIGSEVEDEIDLKDKEVADAALRIQSVYRGFQARKQLRTTSDVAVAAMKIQSVYRGFKTRKQLQQKTEKAEKKGDDEDDLPDLNCKDVADAALKIQSVFRGFQSRRQMKHTMEVVNATMTIQKGYRRFRRRKENEKKQQQQEKQKQQQQQQQKQQQQQQNAETDDDLPDLQCKDVQAATVKIQSVYRGFQTRRKMKSTFEVAHAAMKIQRAYRRFKARKEEEKKRKKEKEEQEEDLPDLTDKDVQKATVKIQSAFRGFKARRSTFEVVKSAMIIQRSFRRYKKRKDAEEKKAALVIQSSYRGFQARKQMRTTVEVAQAAVKIQSVYRGFKTRREADKQKAEETEAALRIQKQFRGFQTRKQIKSTADAAQAAIKIQSIYRGFKERKAAREDFKKKVKDQKKMEVPELRCDDVDKAALQIQSMYRGFQVRKKANEEHKAAVQIQSVYRGFQTRNKQNLSTIDEPQLPKPVPAVPVKVDERDAARGARKKKQFVKPMSGSLQEEGGELLRHPGDVVAAAITLQRFFRRLREKKQGSRMRRKLKQRRKGRRPSSSSSSSSSGAAEEEAARSSSSSSATRSKSKGESSSDEEERPKSGASANSTSTSGPPTAKSDRSLTSSSSESGRPMSSEYDSDTDVEGEGKAQGLVQKKSEQAQKQKERQAEDEAAVKIQAAFKGHKVREQQTAEKSISKNDVAKALAISGDRASDGKKKGVTAPAPSLDYDNVAPPPETAANFGVQMPVRSPLPARSGKLKEVPIPKVPPPVPAKPANGEDTSQSGPPSMAESAMGMIRQSSLGNLFKSRQQQQQDTPSNAVAQSVNLPPTVKEEDLGPGKKMVGVFTHASEAFKGGQKAEAATQGAEKEDKKKGGFFSSLLRRGDKKQKEELGDEEAKAQQDHQKSQQQQQQQQQQTHEGATKQQPTQQELGAKPKQTKSYAPEEDFLPVVLNAMEDNWLKKAPQPTLDKSKALKEEREAEAANLSESERSDLSESSKDSKKMAAQGNDEAAASLFERQDSNGEELPYLETTLPQERPGVITITPSHQRISECKLASINRPRSSSPKEPGSLTGLQQHEKSKTIPRAEKIKVKLPKQDSISKPKPQPESWESFSSKGLQTFKSQESLPQQSDEATPPPKPPPPAPPKRSNWVNLEDEQSAKKARPVSAGPGTFGSPGQQQQRSRPASAAQVKKPPPVPQRTEASLDRKVLKKRQQ